MPKCAFLQLILRCRVMQIDCNGILTLGGRGQFRWCEAIPCLRAVAQLQTAWQRHSSTNHILNGSGTALRSNDRDKPGESMAPCPVSAVQRLVVNHARPDIQM